MLYVLFMLSDDVIIYYLVYIVIRPYICRHLFLSLYIIILLLGGLPSYGLVLLLLIPILKHVQIENKAAYITNTNNSQSTLIGTTATATDEPVSENNSISNTGSPQRQKNNNSNINNNSNNNDSSDISSSLIQSNHLKTVTKHLKVNTSSNMNSMNSMTTSNMQFSPRSRTSSSASNTMSPDNYNNNSSNSMNNINFINTERYTPTNNVVYSPYGLPSPTQLSQQFQLQLQLSSYMSTHPSPHSNHSPCMTPTPSHTAYKNNTNPLRKTPPSAPNTSRSSRSPVKSSQSHTQSNTSHIPTGNNFNNNAKVSKPSFQQCVYPWKMRINANPSDVDYRGREARIRSYGLKHIQRIGEFLLLPCVFVSINNLNDCY